MENISKHIQNSVVYLTITDDSFAKLSGQIPPDFFTSETSSLSFKIASQYFKKFGKAPRDHFHDEILRETKSLSEEEKESLARYLYSLRSIDPPDKDYVISRLDSFIKSASLLSATYEFAELVEKQEFGQATEIMQKALRSGLGDQSIVVNLLEDTSDIVDRGVRPPFIMPIGIPPIDNVIGGLCRGELVLIVGGYKGKKSWFGQHLGKTALKYGLKVLHVSHENSFDEVAIRYDMMFGGLVNEEKPKEVTIKWMDERNIVHKKIKLKGTVYDKVLVKKYRRNISRLGGSLFVKKFPMGSCSAVELYSYINKLETFDGFSPDVVICDYADVMKPISTSTRETRDQLNQTYQYLKQIADEKQIIMITMSQVNREGLKRSYLNGKISAEHVAEDIRKIGTIDKGFFVAEPRELEEYDEMVIGCFANRNRAQNVSCVVGRNLEIGQFCAYTYTPQRNRDEED